MNDDVVIKVEGVSKKYCRTIKHTMLYGATDLAKSFLGMDQRSERLRDGEFWALDNINFELKKGETLGIIGANGSGKSTLLKMLNGIFMPDRGKIEINGKVGALIEVGAGFHPMLTGRENIYINGAILGMTKDEIDRKFDEIIDFADIGEFIDSPVKHYSSGMYVRLGFAIAVHCEPDILLVDEILSVGDMAFRRKCMHKLRSYTNDGGTFILVSHNLPQLIGLCDTAVWIDKSKIVSTGKSYDVGSQYLNDINRKDILKTNKDSTTNRWGAGDVTFTEIKVKDGEGAEKREFTQYDTLCIEAEYVVNRPVDDLRFRLVIRDTVTDVWLTSANSEAIIKSYDKDLKGKVIFEFDVSYLRPRRYTLIAMIANANMTVNYDRWEFGEIIVQIDKMIETSFIPGQPDISQLPFNVKL